MKIKEAAAKPSKQSKSSMDEKFCKVEKEIETMKKGMAELGKRNFELESELKNGIGKLAEENEKLKQQIAQIINREFAKKKHILDGNDVCWAKFYFKFFILFIHR